MSEIINYTRLTTSDKLPDKFVTCQVYNPQDKEKAESGTIFTHIEIDSPWFPTSQIGQTIINTLIKEYYNGKDSSELLNFEEAVKKVNEALAQAAQSGETEWIGKLSGVLILINNSEIHFAQTGKSHSYLYRGGKINHITEGLESEDAPHPLKTFSNLTSGSLQEDDKIVVANNALFEIISPNELKLIITSLPPAEAVLECAKILQNHGSQDANGIFMELTSREKMADLLPEQKVEAVYLDQQILTIGAMGKNAFRNITGSIQNAFKNGSTRLSKFSREKVKPIARKGFEISKEKSKQALEKTKRLAKSNAEKIDEKVEEISNEQGHHERKNFTSVLQTYFAATSTKMRNKIRRPLIKIGFYTRKKSKMYLALLLVVLLILAGAVYFSLANKKSKIKLKEAESSYTRIVALSGEAEVMKSKNQVEGALSRYSEIFALKDKLNNTKYKALAKALLDKADKNVAELAKLTELKPLIQADLNNAGQLTFLENNLIATAGSDLFNGKEDAKAFTKIASLGSEMKLLSGIEDLGLIAGITQNKLVSFNSSGNEYIDSEVALGASSMSAFGSNIYALDKQENSLWKIPYAEGGFKDKSAYFKDSVNVSEIVSFAIDGSLYTLSSSGQIKRYSRGSEASEFSIVLPDRRKIDEYLYISTSETSDKFIVLVKIGQDYRLIEMKKDGEIIKQFKLNDLKSVKSITTNKDQSVIFISSDNKVLSYGPL